MVDPVALQENGMLLAFGDPGPMPDFLIRNKEMAAKQEKPLVWSYTFLHTYESICPYQAYRRFIVRDIPFSETEAMKRGIDGHTAMEYRVGGKPLPREMQAYEPFVAPFDGRGAKAEVKLGVTADRQACDFFDKDVWGRGKADVIVTQATTAYLGDWKFGKSTYESRFELDVQAVLLKAKMPNLQRIVGQYHWLSENRSGELYDLSDTDKAWQKIRDIMYKVEQDKLADNFEKRKGPLCRFCTVGNCENNKNPEFS